MAPPGQHIGAYGAEAPAAPLTIPYYSQYLRNRFSISDEKLPEAVPGIPVGAAISYFPDHDGFSQRSQAIMKDVTSGRETMVPAGWPERLQGELVWSPANPPDDAKYIYELNAEDKKEIHQALAEWKASGLDIKSVNKDTFRLPQLKTRLTNATEEVYNGLGLTIVRGLDVDTYTPEERAVIFLGISSYVAPRRGVQNVEGDVIRHITDHGAVDSQTDQPFHTDVVCDVVGMLTCECSSSGGAGTFASAWTVYNHIAAHRPDIIHELAKPDWPFDTYGRTPAFYRRPLLFHHEGKIILNYARRVLTGSYNDPRTPGIPNLTEAQAEALDYVHYAAKANEIWLPNLKGDMRFVNNLGLLHGRSGFRDHQGEDEQSRRHIIRLWLNNPEKNWELPEPLQLAWARVFEDEERLREGNWDVNHRDAEGKLIVRSAASQCD